jgi:polar amino acid transport system substrate-binding protein
MRALLACLLATTVSALSLVTEDYPPFNMLEENQVSGIASLILRDAIKRAGIRAQFDLYPWARALALAKARKDTCVYSTVRTPEREPQFRWIGPLVEDKIGLFATVENPIRLKTIADARGYRVGGYLSDAYGDYVEHQGVAIDRSPSDTNNLPKLMAGHIDLWVAGTIAGPYRAKREGLAGRVHLVVDGGEPQDTQMWLACNPGVDDATFQKLNDAVRQVLNDGSAARYAARYR